MAWKLNVELRATNKRITENVKKVGQAITRFETQDRRMAAQTEVMAMRLEELSAMFPLLHSEIANLRIKQGRVLQIQGTQTESEKVITTLLRDSIITDTVRVRVFEYGDGYYSVKGVANGDTQRVQINSRDTLIQVVYKGKRKNPALWILSRRKLEQRMTLKNPNAKIVYNQTVQIEK
jgi:hypothetical protein